MANLNDMVFASTDFEAAAPAKAGEKVVAASKVHIRMQQRNGKKSLTTIQGLADDLDLKKILKALKKQFSTNGTILNDKEVGEVIQVQGDQRRAVADFLVQYKILSRDEVVVHGF